jgi:hypothetical protein
VNPAKNVGEGNVESTNWPEGSIKVVWEILPGDSEHIFREISQEDLDPDLLSPGMLITLNDFPLIPHPLLNLGDGLDRVWNQTVIKINYQMSEGLDENEG